MKTKEDTVKKILLTCIIVSILILTGCGKKEAQADPMDEYREVLSGLNLIHFSAAELSSDNTFGLRELGEYDLNIFYFWASWSDTSQSMLPNLKAYKENLPDNIRVITVCTDGEKNYRIAKQVLDGYKYTGKTLISGAKDYSTVIDKVRYLPTIIFINSEGKQVGEPIVGIVNDFDKKLDKSIKKILKENKKKENDENEENEESDEG